MLYWSYRLLQLTIFLGHNWTCLSMRWVGCPPALSASQIMLESVTAHHSAATKKTVLRSGEQRWTSARWMENASRRGGTNNTALYCLYAFRDSPFPQLCSGLKTMSPAGSYLGQRSGALGPWQGRVADQRLSRWRSEKLVQNIQNIASQAGPCGG